MKFIHDDFLLHSKSARHLYHEFAAPQPIIDYHSHLPAIDVAQNRNFENLFEIWLNGDHYKWRGMRANGIPERFCTGDATPKEKFLAWARTVPYTVRNPLYHWTHLELKRYFGIDELLNEHSAESIWERANALLQTSEFSAQNILKKFKVEYVGTTDDPCETLEHHRKVSAAKLGFRLSPTFRPDKALRVHMPQAFNDWTNELSSASNIDISDFSRFLQSLESRHTFFHENGCLLSDHGLLRCHYTPCTEAEAKTIFAKTRAGKAATADEFEGFASFLMLFFGRLNAKRNWTMQLHLGPLRSQNTRMLQQLGPDTGFDSIGDSQQGVALCTFLDLLDRENSLPKTIIYNINPSDNYVFATAIGNFQGDSIPGKIQFGSGWWFLDQKEGMEMQLNALSNTGLLSRFVGMVTDSRSFMSYPRHEYFRRVLCNLLGTEMERGELPSDDELMGNFVRNICYYNARNYLGLELGTGITQASTVSV